MIDVFTADGLRAATAGRWMRRPEAAAGVDPAFAGFGTDTRVELDRRVYVAIRGERHDGHDFLGDATARGASVLLVDRADAAAGAPGTSGVLLVENTRSALAHLARAHRKRLKVTRVVGITGSAGKTTTKRLVDSVLRRRFEGSAAPKSFNNDIGVPLTILAARASDRYLVVEIGANAPGEVGHLAALARPDVAVITTIGSAHLGGFGSREIVAREKAALLTALEPGGLAVVHAEAELPEGILRQVPSVVLFGSSPEADVRLTGRGMLPRCTGRRRSWFEVNGRTRFELALAGSCNAENALAAIAVGRRFGLGDDVIAEGLADVEPADMRLEPRLVGPVLVVNDAYNANPESMRAALESFGELAEGAERRVAVLGGMLELGVDSADLHRELADTVAEVDVADVVVLVGPECGPTFERLRDRWSMERVAWIESVDDAPESVARRVRPGDAVLLKASRGHALERVETEIARRLDPDCQTTRQPDPQ